MDHKAEKTFDAFLSYPEMFFVLGKLSLSSKCFQCEKCLDNKLDDFLKILEKNERRNQNL